jgi:hypothetical protein
MHRKSSSLVMMAVIVLVATAVLGQAPAKPGIARIPTESEDFATAITTLRNSWVQEFNAGHAEQSRGLIRARGCANAQERLGA